MPPASSRPGHSSWLGSVGACSSLFSLLFPAPCRLCSQPLRHMRRIPVCAGCLAALPFLPPESSCSRCGQFSPTPGATACLGCLASPPAYDSIRSRTVYSGAGRSLIHLLKFEGIQPLARFWSQRLAELDLAPAPDVVMAVPLGRQRLRSRGYNQSAEIARHFAQLQGWRFQARGLRRQRETAAQAGLDAATRQRNVEGAFAADPARVAGLRILLIDDVLTTGATARAASAALKASGAVAVSVLTAARADLLTLTQARSA